jgi:hypothetical protein
LRNFGAKLRNFRAKLRNFRAKLRNFSAFENPEQTPILILS